MSVVVPVFDVAQYLPAALDSVLSQDGVELDVVVVDDGSRDASGTIADSFAARDARVRVIHQDNAGLGAARNAGIAAASGEFLAFVDADDELPPGALATLAASLRSSGSDLAVGRVHRVRPDGAHVEPVWITESHLAAPLLGITVDEHPLVIKNIVACNRLYRRSFWDERIGLFPVGVAYEDHVPMLVSYLRGARLDVLDEVTYLWRTRESSISQRKAEGENLADRLGVMAIAWEVVQDEAPPVRWMWLARALELDLAGFYRHAATGDDVFRSSLRDAAARYLDLAGGDALRFVSVHRKVSAWLAANEQWGALEWLEDRDGVLALRRRGTLSEGWPVADGGQLAEHFDLHLPHELLALSEYDTSLRALLTAVTLDDERIEVAFDSWLRGVKRPVGLDEVGLELRIARRPEHPPLHVPATHRGRHAIAVVDVAQLRAWAGRRRARIRVDVRISWGQIERSVPLTGRKKSFSLHGTSRDADAALGARRRLVLRLD
ncbi:MAG: glycosyltransferase, partial [Actinomycetota bacterium]|nr:glycosyltransferase [Actinomycetota bacterium]